MDPSADLDVLVRRVQAGDRGAFSALVEACEAEVRCFVAARAPDLELAEEVMQAAFVIAYERISTYQPRGTFLSWLKGISRNRLSEELRLRHRQSRVPGSELERILADDALAGLEAADDTVDDMGRLDACLGLLPPRSRELFLGRYRDGSPVALLAQRFKRPATALAKLLYRTMQQLRECMQRRLA